MNLFPAGTARQLSVQGLTSICWKGFFACALHETLLLRGCLHGSTGTAARALLCRLMAARPCCALQPSNIILVTQQAWCSGGWAVEKENIFTQPPQPTGKCGKPTFLHPPLFSSAACRLACLMPVFILQQ